MISNIGMSILDSIGNTPLLKFQRIGCDLGVEILGKAEFFNPLGSVKDRIGKAMIENAEKTGALKKGMKVIEPTSGNTGIALAFVCAAKGYSLTLTMPETMSLERRTLLILLGAHVILTPAALGMRGAIAKAIEIQKKDTALYLPSQFENVANPKIHEDTTALEILQATNGNFDVFIAGVGTGGTISGCGRVLKKRHPHIEIFAVEPSESPVLSGEKAGPHKIQGIGAGFVPHNYDRSVVDGVIKVSSEEAFQTAKNIILLEGIPAGISSGAAVAAALKLASNPKYHGKRLLVVLPSYTERYMSTLLAETERIKAQSLVAESVDEKILASLPVGPSLAS
jgi:cysteine synthase A